jgi:arylsulfatase A-like enzyme
MKVVLLLFDSLNRHMLSPYGGTRIHTPNFQRLADRTVTFDRHYVGSLPCMPARRDLHTGRLTFLHRSWGPLEPFDNSFPEILFSRGVYSHLVTDHYHYWEDGGATYHNRYDTYDFIRGQECDRWKALVQPHWERLREKYHERQFDSTRRNPYAQNIINREFIRATEEFPSARCVASGLDFIDSNRHADGWFLQVETFDPHEPFTAPEEFKDAYRTGWNGPVRDWPRYGRVDELPEECEELRANYYATVAMCDSLLGKVLDKFDELGMWDDTALIVTTDHGFLLGEHDFWAKNRMNLYEEIVHIPLFFHDPRRSSAVPGRCSSLTTTIDLAATMLDLFEVEPPAEMQGISLSQSLSSDVLRPGVIFGYFGGAVNVTDGRHTYHLFPHDLANQEIYQYTLMPTHIFGSFTPAELSAASLSAPLSFTKGAPVLKVPVDHRSPMHNVYGPGALLESETRLYDLTSDPGQDNPIVDPEIERAMQRLMISLMKQVDAPPEAYARLALEAA